MRQKLVSLGARLLDWAGEKPFGFVCMLLLFSLVLVMLLYLSFSGLREGYFQGIFVEFAGMIFDIVVFGLLIAFVAKRQTARDEIRRQQEIIDDFKRWNSEEATYRIAGAIRRIAKLGSTAIDFRGIRLRGFSFYNNGITDLSGSKFSDGIWLNKPHRSGTFLDSVKFSSLNAKNCIFSLGNGDLLSDGLTGRNLEFCHADLEGASFEGADLVWDDVLPDEEDWYEYVDGDDFGEEPPFQIYYPAFDGANLKGVTFRNARLKQADFRGAKNIDEANFESVKGLDSCFFDEGVREKLKGG